MPWKFVVTVYEFYRDNGRIPAMCDCHYCLNMREAKQAFSHYVHEYLDNDKSNHYHISICRLVEV